MKKQIICFKITYKTYIRECFYFQKNLRNFTLHNSTFRMEQSATK